MVLANPDKIKNRWGGYYEGLLNEENPRVVFQNGVPNEAVIPMVSRGEVKWERGIVEEDIRISIFVLVWGISKSNK